MATPTLDDLHRLTQWDTPTICNGLEIVCPERRAFGFTTEPLVSLAPQMPPVIGYARTARIRAASPSTNSADQDKKLRLDYYEYIDSGHKPSIVVIEDLDVTPCLLYTSPSPRDKRQSRMPSSA